MRYALTVAAVTIALLATAVQSHAELSARPDTILVTRRARLLTAADSTDAAIIRTYTSLMSIPVDKRPMDRSGLIACNGSLGIYHSLDYLQPLPFITVVIQNSTLDLPVPLIIRIQDAKKGQVRITCISPRTLDPTLAKELAAAALTTILSRGNENKEQTFSLAEQVLAGLAEATKQ